MLGQDGCGSSLTSRAALLVPSSGIMYPVVDRHAFTGSAKSCCESRRSPVIGVSG